MNKDILNILNVIRDDINSLPQPIRVEVEKIVVKDKKKSKLDKSTNNRLVSLEIQKSFCESIGEEDMEDLDPVEINGVKYGWNEESELTTVDEGKYQYGGKIYAVGLLDEGGYGAKEPLFYVRQNFTKPGSYYSCQEWIYDVPYPVEKVEKIIEDWRQIK